jgi:hypothetical protein
MHFTGLICQLECDTCHPLIGPHVISVLCHVSPPGAWLFDLMAIRFEDQSYVVVPWEFEVRNSGRLGMLECMLPKWLKAGAMWQCSMNSRRLGKGYAPKRVEGWSYMGFLDV